MTYQDLCDLLKMVGIPFAFHHWKNPPVMPYGVYFDDYSNNFAADGIAYQIIRHFIIELYVRQRDPELEEKIEAVLTGAGLFWDKNVTYIDSERFYQIYYEIKV